MEAAVTFELANGRQAICEGVIYHMTDCSKIQYYSSTTGTGTGTGTNMAAEAAVVLL